MNIYKKDFKQKRITIKYHTLIPEKNSHRSWECLKLFWRMGTTTHPKEITPRKKLTRPQFLYLFLRKTKIESEGLVPLPHLKGPDMPLKA